MNTPTKTRIGWLLAGLLLTASYGTPILTGCGNKKTADAGQGKHHKPGVGDPGGSIPVQVASVQIGSISATVAVTGNLKALQDVSLAAKTNGRVTLVAAREGDPVTKGELLVQQDASDLEANVRQAQANVQAAQAKVLQARTNLTLQTAQAKQGILQARAQLAAAQQNYQKLKGGSRPQQVLQGQAQVAQAQANYQNAKTNLQRYQSLFSQGAVAKADLDTAQTTYNVQQQLLNNAQASLSLTQSGYQQEDISTGQQQVRQQQANLATAIANAQQVSLRRDDIVAAQAGVAQAQATLAFNQEQVANASIHSPISGIVAARQTEPGQIASPGTVLMRVVAVQTVYYEPTISETDYSQTSVGDPVRLTIDALPGKTFAGRVARVYPAASATGRSFSLRVNVANPGSLLRPGMFARGAIVTQEQRNVPIVPATALVTAQAAQGFQPNTSSDAPIADGTQSPPQQVVLVGPGNTALIRPVQVGIANMSQAEITQGLQGGERIVVVGQQGLKNGDKLAITNAAQTASAGTSPTPAS